MSAANHTLSWDGLKIEQDGHLGYGTLPKDPDRTGLRLFYEFIERLPNGNYLTTDGHMGALEWEPRKR